MYENYESKGMTCDVHREDGGMVSKVLQTLRHFSGVPVVKETWLLGREVGLQGGRVTNTMIARVKWDKNNKEVTYEVLCLVSR